MRASQHPYGLRFRGNNPIKAKIVNVVPQCYYEDVRQPNGRNWADLWYDFNWPGWIKPQIDLAFANGANGIKITAGGAFNDIGTYPVAATLTSRMQQVIAYVEKLGGGIYWGISTPNFAFNSSGTLQAAMVAGMQTVLPVIDASANVFGIDLINEANYSNPSAWGGNGLSSAFAASMAALFAAARPLAPSVPMSVSVSVENASQWNGGYQNYLQGVAPFVDFFDVHPYYSGDGNSTNLSSIPVASDVTALTSRSWFQSAKQPRFFIGEVGVDQGQSSANQTAFVAGIGAITQLPKCYGGNLFSGADYAVGGNSQRYGISDQNVQNPRSQILTPFAQTWAGRLT